MRVTRAVALCEDDGFSVASLSLWPRGTRDLLREAVAREISHRDEEMDHST